MSPRVAPVSLTATFLQPGRARPVYLWAGNSTIALQRTKFPDIPVDKAAHLQAYEPVAAHDLAQTGVNLAFLSMNWGFPPEIERQHWREFERAVLTYRDAGISVFGYVQSSNCVSTGSYEHAGWYARDRSGRRVPYHHGRFMTCWNDAAWLQEVQANAMRVLAAGASGVFFDNVWMGATPWTLGRAVAGFAGCACPRCREAFQRDCGASIPDSLRDDELSQQYLRWRADLVKTRFAGWREAIAQVSPGALVIANNCDPILRDTIGMFGFDLSELASLQDALLVENVAMPGFDARRKRLVANALALKAVRAAAPDKPILAVTYEHGIGLDRVPNLFKLRRGLAEAVAVGAIPTLKGSEYIDGTGRFSVITAPAFMPVRASLTPMLQWLRHHDWLFSDAEAAPVVRVPLQVAATGAQWLDNGPALLAALSLIRAQIPFAFTTDGSDAGADVPVLAMRDVPFTQAGLARLLDLPVLRHIANPGMRAVSRAYFGTVRARRWLDRSGLTRRFLESPFFRLPDNWATVRQLAPAITGPHATADAAILVERWKHQNGRYRLHIVNYTDTPVEVTVHASGPRTLHSPDPETRWLNSEHQRLRLVCYAVVECAA